MGFLDQLFPSFCGRLYEDNSLPDYFVVSCSHNKDKNKAASTRKVIKKLRKDVNAGKKCQSINLRRWHGDVNVDENKFLLSIYGNVQMGTVAALNGLNLGKKVSIVGSIDDKIDSNPNVERQIKHLNNFLKEKYNLENMIEFVPEGEKLSLSNSIKLGAGVFNLKKGESFAFVPGDCPFGYLLIDQLHDEDIKENALVLNVNTPQTTKYANKELFPRNFYKYIIDEMGQKILCKEPNLWLFSKSFLNNSKIADEFYKIRQGRDMTLFSFMTDPKRITNMIFGFPINATFSGIKVIYDNVLNFIKPKLNAVVKKCSGINLRLEEKAWGLKSLHAQDIAYSIFGFPFRLKATHSNPFLTKDADAWGDILCNNLIIKKAKEKYSDSKYDGLDNIIPFGKVVYEFNEYLSNIDQTHVMDDKPYFNNRMCELLENTKEKDVRSAIREMHDNYNNGTLSQGEDIDASVSCLEGHVTEYHRQAKERNINLTFK